MLARRLDRREFVSAALLLASGGALATPLLTFPNAADLNIQPDLFIFDRRLPQAQQVIDSIGAAGISAAFIEGDFTALWSTHLQPLWKQGPIAIAGLTTERTLFILETLAADHRMKLLHSELTVYVADAEPLHQWLIVPRTSARQQ